MQIPSSLAREPKCPATEGPIELYVLQLPIYVPSEEEKKDAQLYANNVRQMLMDVGGFGSSDAGLLDCRAYINLLQNKKPPRNSSAGEAWAKLHGAERRPDGKKLL